MSDLVGQTLGHYVVVEKIGAGGMGEVYRARDTRLEREVAIKVLPEAVAHNPERLARFEREAKLLASLSHQNIAALYGLEEHEGTPYLVMELAEGESLWARLGRGRLPIEDALDVARQIAAGLEAAHGQGVVHRDLKPGNVMVAPDGKVKILDFGLAKMWIDEISGADLTNSPTITAELTADGVLLGTAGYMSPEQARGRRVGKQSDIWSFGVLLYEMLTGSNPLVADTAGETIANVQHKEIDFERLPPLPPGARRALQRCLQRSLESRYRDIGDVRLELEQPVDDEASVEAGVARPSRRWLHAALAVALIAAGASLGVQIGGRDDSAGLLPLEADISLPEGQRLSALTLPSFALSPDGRQLAIFTGPEPDGAWRRRWPEPTRLVLRGLDQTEGVPVAGVDGGTTPVFSPDGRWIAYLDDALYRVPVTGGQRVRINTAGDLDRSTVIGMSWGSNGDLVLGMRQGGLWRVSAQGGEPKALTELDDALGESRHCQPAHLPDGRTVLFTALRHDVMNPEPNAISIWALDLDSGERTWLADTAAQARYANGHLLFMREGDLMAAPFDLARLELTASPRVLQPDVLQARHTDGTGDETNVGHYDVAATGALVYAGAGVFRKHPTMVVWVDRSGTPTPIDIQPRRFMSVRVAPDGSALLLWEIAPEGDAIWNHDLRRGATRRELGGERYTWFAWGPGPDQITGGRYIETGSEILTARTGADSGGTEVLPFSRSRIFVSEWSRDGQVLVCAGEGAIWLCRRGEECQPLPKREDVFELAPALSPDGRWLAFASDESSRREVYVRSTTELDSIQQVSFKGGTTPQWSRDGSELFFYSTDGTLTFYAVAIDPTSRGGLRIGEPELLFKLQGRLMFTNPIRSWDVAPDGRFVFIMSSDQELQSALYEKACPDRIHIVQDWRSR